VLGAGLAGSLMAIYLGRQGHDVTVYDMRRDPRSDPLARGRSINLAISTRGLDALRRVGLADRVLEAAVPMRGRLMHREAGVLAFQPYSVDPTQVINSVSRNALNRLLIDAAAAHPNVHFAFQRKCADVDLDTAAVTLLNTETGETATVDGGVIVAADGAYSVTRRQLSRLDRFDYEQAYLAHGYKELGIPPREDGAFAMEPHALHIWPRGGYMMIALPNQDGSFTCTLFWPFEGPNSFAALHAPEDVERFFQRAFTDAVPLMPTLTADYFANPTSSLVTIRCAPWHYRDRVVLLGDACHAVVPFYGQGANAAFEDCVVLDQCLRTHAPDWEAGFAAYQAARKRHTDALARLALENFVEMRDRVASRTFLAKKRLEKALHRAFPRWFVPLYSMVTFSRTPYADAVARDQRQWRAVRAVGGILALAVAALIGWLLRVGR
jgi:kynurenine 3-monooxygenase